MITVTYVFAGLVVVFLGLVSKYLLPWLSLKLGAEKLAGIIQWIRVLVRAADQMFDVKGMGAEKRRWVEAQLAARGIELDTDEVCVLIEAQVRALKLESMAAEPIVVNVSSTAEEVADWQEAAPPDAVEKSVG